ncbi:hypothetical protein BJ878DRAFT_490486 [Calycina marina]|uniref:Uncharacterized protein n=1 Tax=Calycina marina TaxID=1763456 RepID=A0A9P7Z9W0_9HELO|nr:hypothetical protein BJ878DRAFT_490486 [Calycina marina]
MPCLSASCANTTTVVEIFSDPSGFVVLSGLVGVMAFCAMAKVHFEADAVSSYNCELQVADFVIVGHIGIEYYTRTIVYRMVCAKINALFERNRMIY